MPHRFTSYLKAEIGAIGHDLQRGWDVLRTKGPGHIQFWFIALLIGIASGTAALGFRLGIETLQAAFYRTDDVSTLASHARSLPWYWLLAIPVLGGLAVGVVLNWFTPDDRVRSVADVIEGAALREGRVEVRAGIGSALASLITLSTGGSSGREGPVVHLASVMSTWVLKKIKADGVTSRDLLGCAVAAAVSASFNAPIAGTLFALEVVLRHFAIHAFAPIAIASVAGTIINRMKFGDVVEFTLPTGGTGASFVELPAFLILGLLSGVVASILMRAIFFTEDLANEMQRRSGIPPILRPAIAGLLLGALAIFFPHIIGVGYETTSAALTGNLLLHEAIIFTILKIIAVAITMGGRMGGGVFSPSLMVGALTGLAFGIVATAILPELSGSQTLYALAGMGAMAAAVLGAPISTTMIVFELVGDWHTGLAVMTSVSLSSALATRLVKRSFFLNLLERRGIHVADGPQTYLLYSLQVGSVMRPIDKGAVSHESCQKLIEEGLYLEPDATLKQALTLFEQHEVSIIPVATIVTEISEPELRGCVHHVDALAAYNRALAATAAEEHA